MYPRSLLRLLALAGLLLAAPARTHAQTGRDLTEIGIDLYQRANSPNALERMHGELIHTPEAYLVAQAQPGTLVLLNKRRIRVPAMKYNVALHLLEATDSTGSHVWPPGSIDGFYMGIGADERHFRSYVVRNNGTRNDFVEVLTVDNDCPLVLAVQHAYFHEDAQIEPILRTETKAARTEIGQTVVAGLGQPPKQPLHAIALKKRDVMRLFGTHAPQVAAYATKEQLHYTDLAQLLRMVEYYNQKIAH